MNILHLSNKPVFPQVDGGCVAMARLLQNLEMLFGTVDHIPVSTPKHPFHPEVYPQHIYLPVRDSQTFIDTSLRPVAALRALISGKNYNLERFYSETFAQMLQEVLSQKAYDLVVLESLFTCPYIKVIRQFSKARIVVRSHNAEFQLWEQQAKEASGVKRMYLRSLASTLKREESVLLNSADHIWAITSEDAHSLAQIGVIVPITVIPVAMDIPEEAPDYSCADFFHLGSLNWHPNQLAVQEITEVLWPAFRRNHHAKLHIAGSFAGTGRPAFLTEDQSVQWHGFVEDASDFMRTNGILIAPVRTGSGIRIKLLEALAAGAPCITTRIGAMGIVDPESVLHIAETTKDWITSMHTLCESPEAREKSGKSGQDYMRKYHSFTSVNAQIRSTLES